MSYRIYINTLWNPNKEDNKYRGNVALWPDQMLGSTSSGLPFCKACKVRLISIEDGKFLFCKECGERQEIKLEKEKKNAITNKGGSVKGSNSTILTLQPKVKRKKPMSKEEELERNYFKDVFNHQDFEVGW